MDDHPHLIFIGPNYVCPTFYIENVCEMAHCIQYEDHPRLSRLNSILKSKFFLHGAALRITQHFFKESP